MANEEAPLEPTTKPICYCSFCGKSQHEVAKIIAGPATFICNQCVELCVDILREEKVHMNDEAGSFSILLVEQRELVAAGADTAWLLNVMGVKSSRKTLPPLPEVFKRIRTAFKEKLAEHNGKEWLEKRLSSLQAERRETEKAIQTAQAHAANEFVPDLERVDKSIANIVSKLVALQ